MKLNFLSTILFTLISFLKSFIFTPKPIKAIKRIVLAHTKEKDTVLDCFLGSGTTAQVCKELNRNCIGIEKEKEHYDYCVKNFE